MPNREHPSLSEILASAVAIARGAGAILREGLATVEAQRGTAVQFKTTDIDPVTEYDVRSERYIVGELQRLFPGHRIIGEEGTISVVNPFGPQYWHRMKVRSGQGTRVEHTTREPTYHFQLRAFCAAVLEGKPLVTPPDDAVANMEVIDAVYEAAGLLPRGAGT